MSTPEFCFRCPRWQGSFGEIFRQSGELVQVTYEHTYGRVITGFICCDSPDTSQNDDRFYRSQVLMKVLNVPVQFHIPYLQRLARFRQTKKNALENGSLLVKAKKLNCQMRTMTMMRFVGLLFILTVQMCWAGYASNQAPKLPEGVSQLLFLISTLQYCTCMHHKPSFIIGIFFCFFPLSHTLFPQCVFLFVALYIL